MSTETKEQLKKIFGKIESSVELVQTKFKDPTPEDKESINELLELISELFLEELREMFKPVEEDPNMNVETTTIPPVESLFEGNPINEYVEARINYAQLEGPVDSEEYEKVVQAAKRVQDAKQPPVEKPKRTVPLTLNEFIQGLAEDVDVVTADGYRDSFVEAFVNATGQVSGSRHAKFGVDTENGKIEGKFRKNGNVITIELQDKTYTFVPDGTFVIPSQFTASTEEEEEEEPTEEGSTVEGSAEEHKEPMLLDDFGATIAELFDIVDVAAVEEFQEVFVELINAIPEDTTYDLTVVNGSSSVTGEVRVTSKGVAVSSQDVGYTYYFSSTTEAEDLEQCMRCNCKSVKDCVHAQN